MKVRDLRIMVVVWRTHRVDRHRVGVGRDVPDGIPLCDEVPDEDAIRIDRVEDDLVISHRGTSPAKWPGWEEKIEP